jgi:hypothetical protein
VSCKNFVLCAFYGAVLMCGWIGFGKSSSEKDLLESSCSSCQVKQDKSAYWAPALYFQDGTGNFKIVDQIGGMLV